MKAIALAAAGILALTTLTIDDAAAQGARRGWRQNAKGGITARQVHNREGRNGGRLVGGRRVATDGEGDGVYRARNCGSGEAGRFCRAGVTARNDEGGVAHRSGAVVEGANGGAAITQGGFVRDADGNIVGGRSTYATGADGGSYSAQTTYDSEHGATRTVTCRNAAGEVAACPTR
jgi:hypothetical protein